MLLVSVQTTIGLPLDYIHSFGLDEIPRHLHDLIISQSAFGKASLIQIPSMTNQLPESQARTEISLSPEPLLVDFKPLANFHLRGLILSESQRRISIQPLLIVVNNVLLDTYCYHTIGLTLARHICWVCGNLILV